MIADKLTCDELHAVCAALQVASRFQPIAGVSLKETRIAAQVAVWHARSRNLTETDLTTVALDAIRDHRIRAVRHQQRRIAPCATS